METVKFIRTGLVDQVDFTAWACRNSRRQYGMNVHLWIGDADKAFCIYLPDDHAATIAQARGALQKLLVNVTWLEIKDYKATRDGAYLVLR